MKIRFFFVVLIVCFVLEGCFDNVQKYDDETISKAKKAVENYIHNNYDDIETIEFEDEDYSNPMGGMLIEGTVNGSASFSADLDEDTFEIVSFGEQKGFPPEK